MNPPNKKLPDIKGMHQQPNRQAGRAHQFKPIVAQAKNAGLAPNAGRPVAPPVYRPQAKQNAVQSKTPGPLQTKTPPPAPPVYRPQPVPRCLQMKRAGEVQNS